MFYLHPINILMPLIKVPRTVLFWHHNYQFNTVVLKWDIHKESILSNNGYQSCIHSKSVGPKQDFSSGFSNKYTTATSKPSFTSPSHGSGRLSAWSPFLLLVFLAGVETTRLSVLFTEEAYCFTRNGYFNSRNSHFWNEENHYALAHRRD